MSDVSAVELQQAFSCCGLTRTDAAEDTLKAIWELGGDGVAVGTTTLGNVLGVTPPTTSAMVKRLVDHGLVERADDRSLALSDHGADHARRIVRRHRLLETFLSEVLQVPWDELYAEAELLEHAVSDSLLGRIDALLGHPHLDPHGDPIPQDDTDSLVASDVAIADVQIGTRFRVERLHNRNAEALRYLAELGLRPGVTVEVLEQSPFDGPLWVSVDGERVALGAPLAHLVHGQSVEETS
jgi:DtxR family transcriptional regulator, Mn-dependent transcriptional regulator